MGGFFSVYRLPFSHFKSLHAEFHICCTTFSPLQNGKKKSKKKSLPLSRKMANTTVIVGGFWWFFNKNPTFLAIFITMKQLYSKMDMLFGISVENCIESYIIWKNFFSVKNSPLGDQVAKFLTKRAMGDHRWFCSAFDALSFGILHKRFC